MNTETARAMVAQGEGQRIEFKTSLAEENEAIISLCAFAHADGGSFSSVLKTAGSHRVDGPWNGSVVCVWPCNVETRPFGVKSSSSSRKKRPSKFFSSFAMRLSA